MQNLNAVNIIGNLTRDPELRLLDTERRYVCRLRVAVSGRRRDRPTGEWVDRAHYFDVAVFGEGAVDVAYSLGKGRPVAITGRLDRREWTDEAGARREAVEIHSDAVQFLDSSTGGAEVTV